MAWFAPALLLLSLLLSACTDPEGFVQTYMPEAISFMDDGEKAPLLRAIEKSLEYYRRVPSDHYFEYGDRFYTPKEMMASMRLFRHEYLQAPSAKEFSTRIVQRFHVFESVREGGRESNLFTGYYEPIFSASKRPRRGMRTPAYTLPRDLVKVRMRRFKGEYPRAVLKGRRVQGELVPYFTRQEIQSKNVLARRAQVIAYMNEVDLFILQIQGSGILRFPNGKRIKLGYAGGNGHPYKSIGALMVSQDRLKLEDVSMHSIRTYLKANPRMQREILYANPSYVFFRVLKEGPLGNIQVGLTPGRSMAADASLAPKGGLAHVSTESPIPFDTKDTKPLNRFMMVQDTGGAIQGHGRADLFWGSGRRAEWKASHQRTSGRIYYLVAKKGFLRDAVTLAR